MSSIVVSGDTSGAVTLSAPAVAGTVTVTLPSTSGVMAVGGGTITTLTTTSDITVQGVTVGRGAGAVVTNTAVGYQALNSNTNTLNTAVGYRALTTNTSGQAVTAVGSDALRDNSTGSRNTAVGYGTLANNNTGENNSAVGQTALGSNTTGTNNSALGYDALATNTSGAYNTALGKDALNANTTASNNTAVGYQAGYAYTGTTGYNTFFGWQAGTAVTSGSVNTYIGPGAGNLMTSGAKNTILGAFNGNSFGLDIRTASNYIVLSDGDGNPRASCTTAGAWYFYNTGGSGSDVVNSISGAAAGTSRSLYTGWYGATSPLTGTLSFNVTTNGNVTNTNNSYGPISDIKLKENIVDATPKLEKLLQVRIVNYNLKADLGYESHKQIGVIAQELEQVFPGLVDEFPDRDEEGNNLGTTTKSVKMSVFVPMLIKAIQELKAEVDSLKAQINGASA